MGSDEKNGIQICFCAGNGNALPVFPLDAHESFCLVWDWAAASGKITPAQHLAKLEGAVAGLGITREELDREAAGLDRLMQPAGFIPCVGAVPGLAMQMLAGFAGFRRPGSKCYRIGAGAVHVKPDCRC